MKAGIITYHKAYNYGSALQTYALNRYLHNIGIQAEVINFHSSSQDSLYKIFESPRSLMSIARNTQSLFEYNALRKHKKRFDDFITSKVSLSADEYNENSDLSSLNEIYDKFICGSDQIWNVNCADYTDAYLLDFVSDKSKCISYAPSIGTDFISKKNEEKFSKLLKNYKALSTRETLAAKQISELTGREVSVVPDPVLLLTEREWNEVIPQRLLKEKYIFCYFIGDVAGMRKFAVNMHKKTGLKLVVVYKNIRDLLYPNKKMYWAGPEEFLSLIKNCEYVCTNSFHAVMFSLIFKKNFWVFTELSEGSAKSRIENILDLVGLKERILNGDVELPEDILKPVDFSNIEKSLKEFSEKGQAYLKTQMEEENENRSYNCT